MKGNNFEFEEPQAIPRLYNVVKIYSGQYHCFAKNSLGEHFAWGRNLYGETDCFHSGLKNRKEKISNLLRPKKLDLNKLLCLERDQKIKKVHPGLDFTLFEVETMRFDPRNEEAFFVNDKSHTVISTDYRSGIF